MTTEACRDWRGALAASALGGIEPSEEIALRAHLDGCAACRAELHELSAVAAALAAAPVADVIGAPPVPVGDLGRRVVDRVDRERRFARTRRTRRFGAAGGALAGAAAAAVALVLVLGGAAGPAGTRVVMPGIDGAQATAVLHSRSQGTELDVHVSGLDPGDYYWFWVTGDDGERVPAGTFRGSDGGAEVHLMAAVPLSKARRVWVTERSGRVVLDARLPVAS